ncbi:MAG: chemotaxis protein CheA [Treponema sp.]|nr:chemotaxis protein CheA [Treponema sp.]
MKSKTDFFTQILDTITKLIIAYEPGDVMTISEIIGNLEQFASECKKDGPEMQLCSKLLSLCRKEIHDSFNDFTSCISEGFDLLRNCVESDTTLTETKSGQIQKWLSREINEKTCREHADSVGKEQKQDVKPQISTVENVHENPAEIDSDQLKLFVSDCEGRFSRAQELILGLEQNPEDMGAVKELFRIFHTIKGECGFLKLSTLGMLAHDSESLLDLLRSGKLPVTKEIVDILLKGLDLAQELGKDLKNGDFDAYRSVPVAEYIAGLTLFTTGQKSDSAPVQVPVPVQTNTVPSAPETTVHEQKNEEHALKKNDSEDAVIKVKTGKVNYLVDMIGELLICLGQMKEDTEGLPQVRKIARTLQYAGMQLRTESVHALFGTSRRIIRDTAQKVGKQVQTVFEGEDLEIDRTLIEELEEPLMHLIRNALDHGIETAEERVLAGKPPEGTVRISAERKGNNIVISVGDDGRGLDREKILKKAVSKGLIRQQDTAEMSDTAVNNLIFVSGFSTNDAVNLISGRGVGMDVVKEAVGKAKGHIITESIPGKGTTFSLHFPLSTAIIDGMLTRTGENIFIIPISSIVESFKVKNEQIHQVATGVHVLDLRGRMIPIISIAEVFDIANAGEGKIATIVENVSGDQFAVMNDEILAKREVVIKNLGACFKNLKGISSGSVLSGGAIGFVLDIDQVIELGKENRLQEGGAA